MLLLTISSLSLYAFVCLPCLSLGFLEFSTFDLFGKQKHYNAARARPTGSGNLVEVVEYPYSYSCSNLTRGYYDLVKPILMSANSELVINHNLKSPLVLGALRGRLAKLYSNTFQ